MDGNFTFSDDTQQAEPSNGEEKVDIYKAKCTKKQYPALIKHENETELCSNVGADGRTSDLEDHVHTVQIGWNMSAIDPNIKFREMVSSHFRSAIQEEYVSVTFINVWMYVYALVCSRSDFVSMKRYMARYGLSTLFVEIVLNTKIKEEAVQALGVIILDKKDFSMEALLLELQGMRYLNHNYLLLNYVRYNICITETCSLIC